MGGDEEFYTRALRRVYRNIVWLAAAGTIVVLFWRGWIAGIAFVLGAVGAYLNFSWLHQMVDALGPNARPVRSRVAVFLCLRYALFGIAGYAIVKVFGMNAIAALIALFVPVAAVICEVFYELVHGT